LIRSQELNASAWGERGVPISGFGADVSRARAFRRWLFVEADALTFVQLLERTRLHRASVKEPLLAAIVADKPESAIADQPFDRAVRHVDVPPRTIDGPSWMDPIKVRSTIRSTLGMMKQTAPSGERLQLACRRLKCEDPLRYS